MTPSASAPSASAFCFGLLGRFPAYIGDEAAKLELATRIVKTRNYFTHYDPSLEEDAADGIDLWALCTAMEALFRLLFLSDIGFSAAAIDRIVRKHDGLRQALRTTPGEHSE